MKVKVLIVLVITFCFLTNVSAQIYLADNTPMNDSRKKMDASETVIKHTEKKYTWEFLSATPASFNQKQIKDANRHDFGQRVACLKTLVEKFYITKEDVIPGDPMMRTIVLKPNIYYSTRKLEKYLKQKVKDGDMGLNDAAREMEHILEVALAVIDIEDESSFEALINKNKNSTEKQMEIFNQVKLSNIYF